MTDSGQPRPRRALDPLPPEDREAGAPSGSRAIPFDPDQYPADTETQVLRRVIKPASADSGLSPTSPASPPERPSRAWSPTPVPPPQTAPPKPVLPEPTAALQASAGRRFSASAEPSEYAHAAPRRSATSVSSPPPHEPEVVDPPVGFEPAQAVVSDEPENPTGGRAAEAPSAPRRGRGRAIGVLGIVLAIAAAVAGSVWWLGPPDTATPSTVGSPTPTPSASLDPLLTTADLGSLGGTTWGVTGTPTGANDGNPICLPAGVETMPIANRTARRVLPSDANTASFVTNVVDTYPDSGDAARAYGNRLLQSGSCAGVEAQIIGTSTISRLADAAFATQVEVQAETTEYHAIVVARTGRNVSMVDVLSFEPIPLEDVAAVLAEPLARLCSGGEGVCPSAVTLTDSIPAAGQHPGWLIATDLPRITAGVGRWGATPPSPTLTILGSQCEAIGLTKVSGTSAAAQRTLLLADDPSAAAGFGIDQVVYTFAADKPAKTFADKLTGNISDCPDRIATATVEKGPSTKGQGAEGVEFSGKSYLVTQKTASNQSVPFRVAVIRVGPRVAYLLANPSSEFDFTDAQWKAIMTRTGQRVSQMP